MKPRPIRMTSGGSNPANSDPDSNQHATPWTPRTGMRKPQMLPLGKAAPPTPSRCTPEQISGTRRRPRSAEKQPGSGAPQPRACP
jgi:hypothetical protein